MKQYVDKSVIIAEIDALQDATMENGHFLSSYHEGIFDGLSKIENFLDTIETKEVDELSLEDFFEGYRDLSNDWGLYEAWIFAKYFFELGTRIKSQKGE